MIQLQPLLFVWFHVSNQKLNKLKQINEWFSLLLFIKTIKAKSMKQAECLTFLECLSHYIFLPKFDPFWLLNFQPLKMGCWTSTNNPRRKFFKLFVITNNLNKNRPVVFNLFLRWSYHRQWIENKPFWLHFRRSVLSINERVRVVVVR